MHVVGHPEKSLSIKDSADLSLFSLGVAERVGLEPRPNEYDPRSPRRCDKSICPDAALLMAPLQAVKPGFNSPVTCPYKPSAQFCLLRTATGEAGAALPLMVLPHLASL
jgi:hypothetical protein